MVLITVIPMLVLGYLSLAENKAGVDIFTGRPLITGSLLLSIVLGYVLLSKYPSNIVRLRRYLEDMVEGKLPVRVRLLQGMDDIGAIERSMNLIVEQLSRQVLRMKDELQRIEWLLSRSGTSSYWFREREAAGKEPPYRLIAGGKRGPILNAVGEEMLGDIVGDFVDLLETSAFVFEASADIALEVRVSNWCRFLYEKAQKGLRSSDAAVTGGALLCSECSWEGAAKRCFDLGEPIDVECSAGIRLYCAPIFTDKRIVGCVGFAYGDPPRDPAKLRVIAERYGLAVEELKEKGDAYGTRPPFIVSVAKNRLLTAAKLIGEIIERKQAEEVLRRSEEELRRHRDHLEELVEDRTADLKEANSQLRHEVQERRKAESLKDDFVSTVSHELRTPLAITKEALGLMLDEIPGKINSKQTKVVKSAAGSIDRLARIINDLLDISKIEAGRMEIVRERLNLSKLIRQAVTSLEPLASQKGLEMETVMGKDPVELLADEDRIMQVLTNLIDNAVKFTHEGRITVSVCVRDGEVECVVEDTGIGLAKEDLPSLFNKFVQIKRTQQARQKGTGLGLAIAKNIVELHHGRMWVESELHEGTRFFFALPCYDEEEALVLDIDDRMARTARASKEFALLLVELTARGEGSEGRAQEGTERALLRVVGRKSLVRAADIMRKRLDRQIVVFAELEAKDMAGIWERWQRDISSWLKELDDDGAEIEVHYGYARCPEDGSSAKSLIAAAQKMLAEAAADS